MEEKRCRECGAKMDQKQWFESSQGTSSILIGYYCSSCGDVRIERIEPFKPKKEMHWTGAKTHCL